MVLDAVGGDDGAIGMFGGKQAERLPDGRPRPVFDEVVLDDLRPYVAEVFEHRLHLVAAHVCRELEVAEAGLQPDLRRFLAVVSV